jgi:DNA-binding NarL/FixJ family response regulator
MTGIRVLLVDDEALMREALGDLIACDPSLELVGSAADATQAIELARLHQPDVALLDVKIPGGGGVYAAGQITTCSPGTRIIALTAYADRTTVMAMIGAGARAYLVKGSSGQKILHAVHESLLSRGPLSREAAAEVFRGLTPWGPS